MYVLSPDTQAQLIATLVEGTSIRATARLVGVNRGTIARYLLLVGAACALLHDALMRRILAGVIECDEIWTFVAKKQGHLEPEDPEEFGDKYTFVALDADSKLAISYLVGKRNGATANEFARDLRMRVVGRPQISTDGFRPYVEAIERAFGSDVNFGMVVKDFANDSSQMDAAHRYSPGRVIGISKWTVTGAPNMDRVNTSFIERQNLTMRMCMRRFTRLSNGFSKRLRYLKAAVAIHFAVYNLCRVHETLRVTPAIAAGVTDHVWSIAELLQFAGSLPVVEDPFAASA